MNIVETEQLLRRRALPAAGLDALIARERERGRSPAEVADLLRAEAEAIPVGPPTAHVGITDKIEGLLIRAEALLRAESPGAGAPGADAVAARALAALAGAMDAGTPGGFPAWIGAVESLRRWSAAGVDAIAAEVAGLDGGGPSSGSRSRPRHPLEARAAHAGLVDGLRHQHAGRRDAFARVAESARAALAAAVAGAIGEAGGVEAVAADLVAARAMAGSLALEDAELAAELAEVERRASRVGVGSGRAGASRVESLKARIAEDSRHRLERASADARTLVERAAGGDVPAWQELTAEVGKDASSFADGLGAALRGAAAASVGASCRVE